VLDLTVGAVSKTSLIAAGRTVALAGRTGAAGWGNWAMGRLLEIFVIVIGLTSGKT